MSDQKFKHRVGHILAPTFADLQQALNESYSDCHSLCVLPGYSNAKSPQELLDGTAIPGYIIIGTQIDD